MTAVSWRENLKFWRKKKRVTQADIALHLNTSQQRVQGWEAGPHDPPIDELVKITEFLGISMADLFADVQVNQKQTDKNNRKNVQGNVQEHVQVNAQNYPFNDEISFVGDPEATGSDKYHRLLEKYTTLLEDKATESAFQYRFVNVEATLMALQELILRGELSSMSTYAERVGALGKMKNDALVELGIHVDEGK